MIEQSENSTSKMIQGDDNSKNPHSVVKGVWGLKDIFVNFYFLSDTETGNWILVDTGLASSKNKILKLAGELFGDKPPAAIVLTHGHFDHTGSVETLAHHWHVPVFAHYLEYPYLSGKSSYPPPDPGVGGGLMSALSPFYKNEPIDISGLLTSLPEEGIVPFMKDWKYIHTPGHAPGHISLFRESDKVLIAGDAFVTTQPESLIATITQKQKISGPPMYFTCDWDAAADSVKKLAALNPSVVASGHGKPFSGEEMSKQLTDLAHNFSEKAVPDQGRYVDDPAVADASGILYVPPKQPRSSVRMMLAGSMVLVAIAMITMISVSQREK